MFSWSARHLWNAANHVLCWGRWNATTYSPIPPGSHAYTNLTNHVWVRHQDDGRMNSGRRIHKLHMWQLVTYRLRAACEEDTARSFSLILPSADVFGRPMESDIVALLPIRFCRRWLKMSTIVGVGQSDRVGRGKKIGQCDPGCPFRHRLRHEPWRRWALGFLRVRPIFGRSSRPS